MPDRPTAMLDPLVGYNLRRASGIFGADFARAMEGTGIRQALFGILSVVATEPGINQGAVGRVLGIKRANMVSLINELIDGGLVERTAAPDDRRAFSLKVTDAGGAMLERCFALIARHEDAMLSDFTSDERVLLVTLLRRINRRAEDVG